MANEDGKSGDGGGKASSIVREAASTKEVRRSAGKNSLYMCCGCDYEKDVIQPSVQASAANQNRINQNKAITAASPLKSRASITTQASTGDVALEIFPPPDAAAMVDYLKSHGFPIGLCKSMVYMKSVPWRIVLVDCRYLFPFAVHS